MTWAATGIMAAVGVKQGIDNNKRQKKMDKGRQAAIRYSWASGLDDPGMQDAGPGAMASGMRGAFTGAMIGQSVNKGGAEAEAEVMPAEVAAENQQMAMNKIQAAQAPSPVVGGSMGGPAKGTWQAAAQPQAQMQAQMTAPPQGPQAPGYLSANGPAYDPNAPMNFQFGKKNYGGM